MSAWGGLTLDGILNAEYLELGSWGEPGVSLQVNRGAQLNLTVPDGDPKRTPALIIRPGTDTGSMMIVNGGSVRVDASRTGKVGVPAIDIEGGSLTVNSGEVHVEGHEWGITQSMNTVNREKSQFVVNGGTVDINIGQPLDNTGGGILRLAARPVYHLGQFYG